MRPFLKRVAAALALSPAAVTAAPTVADWVLAHAPQGARLSGALPWSPQADRVQVADPIVFPDGLNSHWIPIPDKAAQLQMVTDGPPYHEPAAVILTFDQGTPACRKPAGVLGVDAGMGAFLTQRAQDGITAYLTTLPEGWTLYDGLIYDQNRGDRDRLTVFTLPDGTEFAGFSTGGDGGFAVSQLFDASGNMLALMVDLSRTAPSDFALPAC